MSLSGSRLLFPPVHLGRISSFTLPSQSLWGSLAYPIAQSPSSSRLVNPIAPSCLVLLLSRGISRSPPHLAFPISLWVPSLTRSLPRSSLLHLTVPVPILVLSLSAIPLRVPNSLPVPVLPGPSLSPGALAEPLATPLPGCSRPLRGDSGCHSGARALTSALSPAAPAPTPPLTRARSRSRAGSSRAESPRAASARESPSRPTLHAGL